MLNSGLRRPTSSSASGNSSLPPTETLEFKSDRGDPKKTLGDLVSAATCLANGQGGTVVAGVENAVVGVDAYSGTRLDILEVRRYIFDTADPRLTVSVVEHTHRNARLLIIGVPVGAAVHSVAGKVTRRVGRSCLPLAPDQVAALHAERQGRDPSEERSGRSIDELDPVAVGLARRLLQLLTDDRAHWAELSDSQLCETMGVAMPDGELLVAGEQLFCATSTATADDIAPLIQRSAVETARTLQRIAAAPFPLITSIGVSGDIGRRRYRLSVRATASLGTAVAHRRYSSDEIEAAVVAHLLEHGRITNQIVRSLFGVGTPRASAILRELVDKGMVGRTSQASRGPGVEYGPGPEMPPF